MQTTWKNKEVGQTMNRWDQRMDQASPMWNNISAMWEKETPQVQQVPVVDVSGGQMWSPLVAGAQGTAPSAAQLQQQMQMQQMLAQNQQAQAQAPIGMNPQLVRMQGAQALAQNSPALLEMAQRRAAEQQQARDLLMRAQLQQREQAMQQDLYRSGMERRTQAANLAQEGAMQAGGSQAAAGIFNFIGSMKGR